MTIYSGTQTHVFCMVESTYGTAVPPASTTVVYDRIGLESNVSFAVDNSVTGIHSLGSTAVRDNLEGAAKISGSIDFVYNSPVPFCWILGGVADEGAGADPRTWTITDADAQKPFTTNVIQDGTTDTDYQLTGCIAQSLSFSMDSSGAPASGSMGFVAEDLDLSGITTTPTTINIDTEIPWNMRNVNVEIPDGSDITTATGVSLDLSRGSDVVHSLGSRVARGFYTGPLTISGTVDFYVADGADTFDIIQQVLGVASATGIQSSLTETTLTIDRGYTDTTADTWEIDLNGVTLSTGDLTFPLESNATYSVGFMAEDIQILWEAPVVSDAGW